MARHVLKRENYRQWDCFKWEDYQERALMTTTFMVRHWPLTNGTQPNHDRFEGYLTDPECWDTEKKTPKKFVPIRVTGVTDDEPQCDTVMIWDSDKQMLVPLV